MPATQLSVACHNHTLSHSVSYRVLSCRNIQYDTIRYDATRHDTQACHSIACQNIALCGIQQRINSQVQVLASLSANAAVRARWISSAFSAAFPAASLAAGSTTYLQQVHTISNTSIWEDGPHSPALKFQHGLVDCV